MSNESRWVTVDEHDKSTRVKNTMTLSNVHIMHHLVFVKQIYCLKGQCQEREK